MDEDNTFTYTLSANDVDGDALTYSATASDGSVSVIGTTLTLTPDQDFNGDIQIDVTVDDGALTDSGSFTLIVNPVNDAPVLSSIDSQSVDEDNTFTYTLLASDVDDIELEYTASVDANASVSIDGSSLSISPNLN